MFVKIFKFIAVIVLLLVVCLAISIPVRQHTKFDAPYPQITSSKDSSVIARGKYLVYGVAKCASCHGNSLNSDSLIHLGQEPDLSGGLAFEIAFGRFYSSNITSDRATGIGGMTDKELARVLRHNVKKNGEVIVPLMTAQNLSDEDLTAIISYLRTLKPVTKQSAKQEYNFLGKLLKAYVLQPQGPDMAVVKVVQPDTTAVYGKYVAIGLANCRECHTKQSNTGEYIGKPMEGGRVFEMPGKEPLASPNITFKKEGRLHGWTLDAFIQRFRAGKLIEHSHMPWGSFSRMSDNDLKALYKYLQDPE